MNKWAFLSIATVCVTVVALVDRFFPEYEEDD